MKATAAAVRRRTPAAVVVFFALVATFLIGGANPAHAEAGDQITEYDIKYDVQANGDVNVTETIDYTFAGYGRHGIYRSLIVRGPAGDDRDRVYEISDFDVESPTGASTELTEENKVAEDGRTTYETYQIGNSEQYVDQTETYVLTYTISGALNPQDDADTELYWNATGNLWDAEMLAVTVTVTAPGDVQKVECYAGPEGSDTPCASADINGGKGVFTAEDVGGNGSGVTIVAALDPAAVSAEPIYEDPPTWASRNGFNLVNSGIGVVLLAIIGFFGFRARSRSRDMRFVGVPPGVVPAAAELQMRGNGIGQKPDDGSVRAPVAFSPPRDVSPAQASYLRKPGSDDDQLAATILDLAHRGALRISGSEASDDQTLIAADLSVATRPHEKILVQRLFSDEQEVSLSYKPEPGVAGPLHKANKGFTSSLVDDVRTARYFTDGTPGGRRRAMKALAWLLIGVGAIGAVFGLMQTADLGGSTPLTMFGLIAVVGGVLLLVLSKTGDGQGRTAVGRAVMDQVDGFELYLRTAEADQLKFEAGEDIFSRYLPWAVVFDITERWSQICRQLVAEGRIPAQPDWYYGTGNPMLTAMWISSFSSSVGTSTAAAPPTPSAGGSGTGFGGSSGFGGGFSGGGGGGGGGGSW